MSSFPERITQPFGQPSIDDWVTWYEDKTIIYVKYRKMTFRIAHTLFDEYEVLRTESLSNAVARLPELKYADLPWWFQAEKGQWLPLLNQAFAGLAQPKGKSRRGEI